MRCAPIMARSSSGRNFRPRLPRIRPLTPEDGAGLSHHLLFAGEREHRFGSVDFHPARLLDFVVVLIDITAFVLE